MTNSYGKVIRINQCFFGNTQQTNERFRKRFDFIHKTQFMNIVHYSKSFCCSFRIAPFDFVQSENRCVTTV